MAMIIFAINEPAGPTMMEPVALAVLLLVACSGSDAQPLNGHTDEKSLQPVNNRRQAIEFAGRTCSAVCTRWNADYPAQATSQYNAGTGCGAGSIDATANADAVRRVNLFRWLVGLNDDVATGSAATIKEAQDAAKMMDANNQLDHNPPTSWNCYTADGAAGAGSGNLALGYSSAASTVDGYMRDSGTPSLGHRRWIISSGLTCTTFGHYNRGGCQKVFGFGSSGSSCGTATGSSTAFVAFPPPGDVPEASLRAAWSFARTSGSVAGATVTVTNTATCANVPVTTSVLGNGYGNPTISFGTPAYTLNEPLLINITFSDGAAYGYTLRIVDCASCPSGSIPANTCGPIASTAASTTAAAGTSGSGASQAQILFSVIAAFFSVLFVSW